MVVCFTFLPLAQLLLIRSSFRDIHITKSETGTLDHNRKYPKTMRIFWKFHEIWVTQQELWLWIPKGRKRNNKLKKLMKVSWSVEPYIVKTDTALKQMFTMFTQHAGSTCYRIWFVQLNVQLFSGWYRWSNITLHRLLCTIFWDPECQLRRWWCSG